MKSIIIIFAALLLILATPFVFIAIDNALTDNYTQSFTGVATGAGVYSGNVTLSRALYGDDTTAVTAISSNTSGDAGTAGLYNTVSHELQITGLVENTTHTLTVAFLIDNPILPAGYATFFVILRWFWLFLIIGTAGGAIYAFFD